VIEPNTITIFGFEIVATYVVTAGLSALLGLLAFIAGRQLKLEGLSLWQTAIEIFVGWIEKTVREVVDEDPAPYVPLIATLMVFIACCNLLSVVPVVRPPTAEISTTVALALVVFVAVPVYGIRRLGLLEYLAGFGRPSPFLIPFNLLGEVTRTLALAVRLFGNVMSATLVGAVLVSLAGFLVPIPLMFLDILIGLLQAYIFGILATVYIAAAMQVERRHASQEDPRD